MCTFSAVCGPIWLILRWLVGIGQYSVVRAIPSCLYLFRLFALVQVNSVIKANFFLLIISFFLLDRWFVRGKRTDYELLENKPDRDDFALKLKKKWWFFGKEKFGIVRTDIEKDGSLKIQHTVYEVTEEGDISVETKEVGFRETS